jgi:peptidoglycan/LPS O-acetylase OafA/YrhL
VPELDALRAIAAGVVLLFHLNPPRFFFGWTGVDLFFVLSGYLITTIILDHQGTAGFYLSFYARRSLRIWPIYYLALAALVAGNRFLPKPAPMDGLPYYLTYTQNVPSFWHRPTPPFNPAFDHTWTLALEEQFYLIWPALIALVGRRRLIPLCGAVVAINVMARDGGWFARDPFIERILIARSDGFALGGLLAALLADRERIERRLGDFRRLFGLTLLAATAYLGRGLIGADPIGFLGLPTPSRPGLTILMVAVFYFGVIGCVLSYSGHPALGWLRSRPLCYLGKISYGIYLFHYIIYWIIDGFGFNYHRPPLVDAAKVGASVAAAIVSWHLIESPILSLKRRFAYAPSPRDRPP